MNCKEYQDDLKRRAQNDDAARQTQQFLEVNNKLQGTEERHSALRPANRAIRVQALAGRIVLCSWARH